MTSRNGAVVHQKWAQNTDFDKDPEEGKPEADVSRKATVIHESEPMVIHCTDGKISDWQWRAIDRWMQASRPNRERVSMLDFAAQPNSNPSDRPLTLRLHAQQDSLRPPQRQRVAGMPEVKHSSGKTVRIVVRLRQILPKHPG